MANGVLITNEPKIKAFRREFTTYIASSDASYSLQQIVGDSGISIYDVLAVTIEGARPETSWTEVHPVTYYNANTGQWGVHNYGTGGNAIVDFVVIYKDYS